MAITLKIGDAIQYNDPKNPGDLRIGQICNSIVISADGTSATADLGIFAKKAPGDVGNTLDFGVSSAKLASGPADHNTPGMFWLVG